MNGQNPPQKRPYWLCVANERKGTMPHRGRIFSIAIVALWAAAVAQPAPSGKSYRIESVGPGVFAFLAEESLTPVVSGNSLAVVGDDGILVVDTGNFPTLARRMIADLRARTHQPVRYVVHTHWHPDHWVGDGEFRKAFPGVVIVSTAFTRQAIEELAPKYVRAAVEKGAGYVAALDQEIQSGKGQDGSPLPDADKEFLRREIEDLNYGISEYKQAELVVPNLTFDGSVSVFLGKREVRISFLGRGNTAGDAVVEVPDSKVVATGDLLVYPTPYSYGSYPGEWIETLARLMALGATTVVPGHGPVFHDWEYARTVSALLTSVRTQVRAAVDAGLDLEATRKRVDLSEFRRKLAGDDPDKGRAFDVSFTNPSVERAYQEARGRFEPET